VFGRLGSFGLSVMKTKADRMWEEFGANLAAILRRDTPGDDGSGRADTKSSAEGVPCNSKVALPPAATSAPHTKIAKNKWWARLAGSGSY